jgi:hypothetical protein
MVLCVPEIVASNVESGGVVGLKLFQVSALGA